MTYLTTTDIIDSVLAVIQDQTTPLRTRILSYVNSTLQALAIERNWTFLQKTITTTIANGIITTPSDFKNFTEVTTDSYTLTNNDLISDKQADNSYSTPKILEVTGGLQIIPTTTGSVSLTYIRNTPLYQDEDVKTIFPLQTRPYIERAVLTMYYEYDADDRWGNSLKQTTQLLLALKRWDNSLRPLPQNDSRGMKY